MEMFYLIQNVRHFQMPICTTVVMQAVCITRLRTDSRDALQCEEVLHRKSSRVLFSLQIHSLVCLCTVQLTDFTTAALMVPQIVEKYSVCLFL